MVEFYSRIHGYEDGIFFRMNLQLNLGICRTMRAFHMVQNMAWPISMIFTSPDKGSKPDMGTKLLVEFGYPSLACQTECFF